MKKVNAAQKIWGDKKTKKKLNPIYDVKKIPKGSLDSDGDGVKDVFDCEPYNAKKDGFINKTINFIRGRGFKENEEPQEVKQPEQPQEVKQPEQKKEDLPNEIRVSSGVVPLVVEGFKGAVESTKNLLTGKGYKTDSSEGFSARTNKEKELIKRLEAGDYDKTDPDEVKKAESLMKLYNVIEKKDVERSASMKKEGAQTAKDIAIMYTTGKVLSPSLAKAGNVVRASKVVTSSKVAKPILTLGTYGLEQLGLVKAGGKVSELTGSKENKQVVQDFTIKNRQGETVTGQEAFNVLLARGESNVQQKLKDTNKNLLTTGRNIGYQFSPYMFKDNPTVKNAFVEQLSTDLNALGITGDKKNRIIEEALRQRREKSAVEITALLRAEGVGNVLGGQSRSAAINKLGGEKALNKLSAFERAKFGFKTRLLGGAGEGLTSAIAISETRTPDATTKEKLAQYGIGTGLGAVAAGTFGSGEEVINKFRFGKPTSTTAGYTLDIAEAPGDRFTNLFLGGSGPKSRIKTLSTSKTGTTDFDISTGQSQTKTDTTNKINEFVKDTTNTKTDVNEKIDNQFKTNDKVDNFDINRDYTSDKVDEEVKEKINENVKQDTKLNEEMNTFIMTPKKVVPPFGFLSGLGGGAGRGGRSVRSKVIRNKVLDITKGFNTRKQTPNLRPLPTQQVNTFNNRNPVKYMRTQPKTFSNRVQNAANKGFGKLKTKQQKNKQLFGAKKQKWI